MKSLVRLLLDLTPSRLSFAQDAPRDTPPKEPPPPPDIDIETLLREGRY